MADARILVVEDERIVAMDIRLRLESLGYTVVGMAVTGSDAIRQADELKPDLVLMDIMLAGEMDGIQAATAIRDQWQIPVVYVTAYTDIETLERSKMADPFGYIHKPVDQKELHATIEMALYKHVIECRLQESEQWLSATLSSLEDAVIATDAVGHVKLINAVAERLTGWDRREIIGQPLSQVCRFVDENDERIARDPLSGRLEEKNVPGLVTSLVLCQKQGQRIPVNFKTGPIRDRLGKISGAVLVFYDSSGRRQAAIALHESEMRYKRLLESVTDYIYTVKVENGRAVSTTHGAACVTVTGYSSTDYASDPNLWYKMVHIDDRKMILDQSERLLAGKTIQPVEHRIIHKSGKIRWVKNMPVPHRDVGGHLIAYDGLISDITERKLAEEQIKAHAHRLEILNRVIMAVNKAEDMSALLTEVLKCATALTRGGVGILLLNPRTNTADLTSSIFWTEEQRAAMNRLPLTAAPLATLIKDGQAVFLSSAASSVAPGPSSAVLMAGWVPLVSNDKVIGVLVSSQSPAETLTPEVRETLQAIGRQVGTAISKMRFESALKESEEKYRTISEQSLVGMQIIKGGRLVFVNEGWSCMVGYTRKEAESWGEMDFVKIIHPDDRTFFLEQARKKQAGITEGIVPIYDCRFIAKNGDIRWILLHSKTVRFSDGNADVGMVVDITDRKLAEQALATANRRIKAREEQVRAVNQELFAANEQLKASEKDLLRANRDKEMLLREIHHRVKNNLQVISSLMKLQMGHIKDPQAISVLRECQSRIRSIAIVHEKLYQSSSLAEIDIGDYLRSITSHLFRMYLADPESIALTVTVDEVQLGIDKAIPCSLIINELVSNALKYAFSPAQKGEIAVRLQSVSNGRCKLSVTDNGVGFPSTIDFRNTSSLGLQLVMTFVDQLGGTITLDNRQGAAFTILFDADKKEVFAGRIDPAVRKASVINLPEARHN